MIWIQERLTLAPRPRGFHLITQRVLAALPGPRADLGRAVAPADPAHLGIADVERERLAGCARDFESWFNAAVPEGAGYWTHTLEGPDDMPAHVKAALLGPSLTLPVSGGRLALGTWQGIYLCEHRDHGGPRSIVATAWGKPEASP